MNLLRKKSFFCVTSLIFLYTAASFAGTLFLYDQPRTGEPFVSLDAMMFFSCCYSILLIPLLFFDDMRPVGVDAKWLVNSKISSVIACMTLLSFSYFAAGALPELKTFLAGGEDRQSFRIALDMSRTHSFSGVLMNLFGTLSYVSLFLGVLGMCFTERRWLAFALFVGGNSHAMSVLKMAARSGVFQSLSFCAVVFALFWRYMPDDRKRKSRVIALISLCLILIPFVLITFRRFNAEENEQGVFYSLFSYFSTGMYSFNVDYAAFSEFDLPRSNGAITCSFLPQLNDLLFRDDSYERGKEALDELHDPGYPEYKIISGAFSGEFKTLIGSLVLDYPMKWVVCICVGLCCLMSVLFVRLKRCVGSYMLFALYLYMMFMAPIGFCFGTRYQNIILLVTVVFGGSIYWFERVHKAQFVARRTPSPTSIASVQVRIKAEHDMQSKEFCHVND